MFIVPYFCSRTFDLCWRDICSLSSFVCLLLIFWMWCMIGKWYELGMGVKIMRKVPTTTILEMSKYQRTRKHNLRAFVTTVMKIMGRRTAIMRAMFRTLHWSSLKLWGVLYHSRLRQMQLIIIRLLCNSDRWIHQPWREVRDSLQLKNGQLIWSRYLNIWTTMTIKGYHVLFFNWLKMLDIEGSRTLGWWSRQVAET